MTWNMAEWGIEENEPNRMRLKYREKNEKIKSRQDYQSHTKPDRTQGWGKQRQKGRGKAYKPCNNLGLYSISSSKSLAIIDESHAIQPVV